MKTYGVIVDAAGEAVPTKTIKGLKRLVKLRKTKAGLFKAFSRRGTIFTWSITETAYVLKGKAVKKITKNKGTTVFSVKAALSAVTM